MRIAIMAHHEPQIIEDICVSPSWHTMTSKGTSSHLRASTKSPQRKQSKREARVGIKENINYKLSCSCPWRLLQKAQRNLETVRYMAAVTPSVYSGRPAMLTRRDKPIKPKTYLAKVMPVPPASTQEGTRSSHRPDMTEQISQKS